MRFLCLLNANKHHLANRPQNLVTLLTRLHPQQPGQQLGQLHTVKNLSIIHGDEGAKPMPTRKHPKLHNLLLNQVMVAALRRYARKAS